MGGRRQGSAALVLILAASSGCEPEPRTVGKKAAGPASAPSPVASAPAPAPAPVPPTAAESRPRDTLGKTTTDIRDAPAEAANRGAVVSTGKIVAKDPITISGNAYVSIVGQASVLKIKHALDLYHAENQRYPKDLDEFMGQIIRPNGIALPTLPYYQEYGYNAASHSLVVMEYPDRKEARQRELESR